MVPLRPKDAECFSQMPKDTRCSKFLVNKNISMYHNGIMNKCNILTDGDRKPIDQIIPPHHTDMFETSCDMRDAAFIASYTCSLNFDEESKLAHNVGNSIAPVIDEKEIRVDGFLSC